MIRRKRRQERRRISRKEAWLRALPVLLLSMGTGALISGTGVYLVMSAGSNGSKSPEQQAAAGEDAGAETDGGTAEEIVIQDTAADAELEAALERMEALQTELESMTAAADGTWSIYVEDLGTETEISVNSQQMYAASLIKLFVMQSTYEYMDQIVENGSIYSGSTEQSSLRTEELLTNMITVSDNESYNELVRMHSASLSFTEGCAVVEEYIQASGYENTGIFHTLHPSDSVSESTSDEENYTSAEDCGALLESIYNGTCVSESASEEMLELLMEQQSTGKIPAGVPEGVLTANKTGETDEVQHDAAIVFGEETDYTLSPIKLFSQISPRWENAFRSPSCSTSSVT